MLPVLASLNRETSLELKRLVKKYKSGKESYFIHTCIHTRVCRLSRSYFISLQYHLSQTITGRLNSLLERY